MKKNTYSAYLLRKNNPFLFLLRTVNKRGEKTQTIARIHCVGCGTPIAWNGKGAFAYTCLCGGTLFADQNGNFSIPSSLVLAVEGKRTPPHIDYYLGISNYISIEKNRAYEELVKLGCTWSWECPECKEKFVKLKREQSKAGMLMFELHPALKALF